MSKVTHGFIRRVGGSADTTFKVRSGNHIAVGVKRSRRFTRHVHKLRKREKELAGWQECFLPSGKRTNLYFFLIRFLELRISAICTAFVAAPFLMLSATTHMSIPLGIDMSSLIRPTSVSSCPSASRGIG